KFLPKPLSNVCAALLLQLTGSFFCLQTTEAARPVLDTAEVDVTTSGEAQAAAAARSATAASPKAKRRRCGSRSPARRCSFLPMEKEQKNVCPDIIQLDEDALDPFGIGSRPDGQGGDESENALKISGIDVQIFFPTEPYKLTKEDELEKAKASYMKNGFAFIQPGSLPKELLQLHVSASGKSKSTTIYSPNKEIDIQQLPNTKAWLQYFQKEIIPKLGIVGDGEVNKTNKLSKVMPPARRMWNERINY
ncbi:unnamed protein product, partial [Amoebophrya sp. A25]